MATKEELKEKFSTGKIPTGADFAKLIDGVKGDSGKDGIDGKDGFPDKESWELLLSRVIQLEVQINEVEDKIEPIDEDEYGDVPTSVTINQGDVVTFMEPGVIKQLSVTVSPEDAEQKVVWSTSDNRIAKVDSYGLAMAISAGECVITATSVVDETITDTITAIISDY